MTEFRGIPNFLQMCYGKEAYDDHSDARKVLQRIKKEKPTHKKQLMRRGPIDIYRCFFCRKYHIGHDRIKIQSKQKKQTAEEDE